MQHTLLGFSALFMLAACSTDVDDLFGGADGTAGDGGANTTTATGTTTSGPSGPGSTTTGTTATTSTSGSTTTSVTTGQTTTVTTGPDPITTVACGGAGDCSIEAQGICCWNYEEQQGECLPNEEQCQNAFDIVTAIECQLPSQCPGQVCCARREYPSNQSPYGATACAAPDDCADPDRIVCDPNGPACPGNQNCVPSQLLPPGYHICSPN
jgi:hypothetical protein